MRHTVKRTSKGARKTQKKRPRFFFNPRNPNKSFDVYINKNPSDTIPIKYKTLDDVKDTISRLEQLYKSGQRPHKRIWQVGMIMKVRLEVLKEKKAAEYALANRYFKFLGKRTKLPEDRRRVAVFRF
jgi:benzoyl-CoA reductase/2-hydroxyglutaryl-CoA dehydratase subunit BcrC/BadD/HgdB